MEKATFAAGCFWGVEDFFRQVPGVVDAVSGYAGGTTDNPTYRQVCNDETYHHMWLRWGTQKKRDAI